MNAKHSQRRPERQPAQVIATVAVNRRRSSRMALHAAVELSGEDRGKCSFTMPAKATNLNRHGAIVKLHRDLPVGSVLCVKNKRGAKVAASVVAQIANLEGIPAYAIEFVEKDDKACNFWGISFPSNA